MGTHDTFGNRMGTKPFPPMITQLSVVQSAPVNPAVTLNGKKAQQRFFDSIPFMSHCPRDCLSSNKIPVFLGKAESNFSTGKLCQGVNRRSRPSKGSNSAEQLLRLSPARPLTVHSMSIILSGGGERLAIKTALLTFNRQFENRSIISTGTVRLKVPLSSGPKRGRMSRKAFNISPSAHAGCLIIS